MGAEKLEWNNIIEKDFFRSGTDIKCGLQYFPDSPTYRKHGHIRMQECDRINAIIVNLNKLSEFGVKHVKTKKGWNLHYSGTLTVKNAGKIKAEIIIDTFNDHRACQFLTFRNQNIRMGY